MITEKAIGLSILGLSPHLFNIGKNNKSSTIGRHSLIRMVLFELGQKVE
jgi:hypothetical protein